MTEEQSSYRQIVKATSVFGGVQGFNILISIIRSKVVAVLLGPAGIYSLNYERVLWNGSGWKTTVQVVLSFFGNQNWKGMNFPIAITQLKSFRNHHIEVGVGALPNVVLYSSNAHEEPPQNLNGDIYFNGRIGYRFQNPERHFIFRAGYTPIVYPEFGHWGGIAFGWTF